MKKFILLSLISLYLISLSTKTHSLTKTNFKNHPESCPIKNENLCEIQNNKTDDLLQNSEDFKKIYLKIIEDLSFRNTLWEQCPNFIEILDKNKISDLWAKGIMNKNGTLLYFVSNENIKSQLKNLFKDNTSWLIENDKYIIESFEISKPKKLSKNIFSYEISYKAVHIDGEQKILKQTISVECSKNHSKICEFSNIIPQN